MFHVVLVEPEIPNNTGNIGRTCVATGCSLHLVHPLGFDVSEKACRRAGLDYWPRLGVQHYANWNDYCAREPRRRRWLFTTRPPLRPSGAPAQCYFDVAFEPGDALVFGKETAGLDQSLLEQWPDACVFLPMTPGERSLNLATAVCAGVYEAMRQQLVRGTARLDAMGHLKAGG